MRFFEELKTAANDVNLELSEKQYEQFIKYMRLVQEWNEKINLTAITEDEEEENEDRHFGRTPRL